MSTTQTTVINQLRALSHEFAGDLDKLNYPNISKHSQRAVEFNSSASYPVVCAGKIYDVSQKVYDACDVIPDKFLYAFLKK